MTGFTRAAIGVLALCGCGLDEGLDMGQPFDASQTVPDMVLAAPPDIAGVDLALAPVEGWPMAYRDAQRRSRASQPGPRSAPAVKWVSADAYGDPLTARTLPTILVGTDGTIYASGGKSGAIDLLDPVDGRLMKTLPFCDALALGPGGALIVEPCSDAPQLCAVDAHSGERRWCKNTPQARSGPVVVSGDTLYASFPGEVRALAIADGALRWNTALDATHGLALLPGGNLVAAGTVEVNALESSTGRIKWTGREGLYLKLVAPPSVGIDGTVYAVHDLKGGYVLDVVALHPGSGQLLWRSDFHVNWRASFAGPPAVAADGSLRTTGDKLAALSREGKPLWEVTSPNGGGGALIDSDGVTFAPRRLGLVAVGEDGKERWSVPVDVGGGPLLLLRGGVLLGRGEVDGRLRAVGE